MSRDWRFYATMTEPAVHYALPLAERYADDSDLIAMCHEALTDQQKIIDDQAEQLRVSDRAFQMSRQVAERRESDLKARIDRLLEQLATAKGYPDTMSMLMREPVNTYA